MQQPCPMPSFTCTWPACMCPCYHACPTRLLAPACPKDASPPSSHAQPLLTMHLLPGTPALTNHPNPIKGKPQHHHKGDFFFGDQKGVSNFWEKKERRLPFWERNSGERKKKKKKERKERERKKERRRARPALEFFVCKFLIFSFEIKCFFLSYILTLWFNFVFIIFNYLLIYFTQYFVIR